MKKNSEEKNFKLSLKKKNSDLHRHFVSSNHWPGWKFHNDECTIWMKTEFASFWLFYEKNSFRWSPSDGHIYFFNVWPKLATLEPGQPSLNQLLIIKISSICNFKTCFWCYQNAQFCNSKSVNLCLRQFSCLWQLQRRANRFKRRNLQASGTSKAI